MADVFEFPMQVRYMEVDAQRVVFNAWYLTYFDEAFAAFLGARGLPYPALLEAGFDTQLIHSEIGWKAGLRWQEEFAVAVSTARLGRTSFAVDFEARRAGGQVACGARTVYVVIATSDGAKRQIPPLLAAALGAAAPLRSE